MHVIIFIDAPQDTSITYNESTVTVSWKGPNKLPAESSIRDELHYKIVRSDVQGDEELGSVPTTHTSITVPGSIKGSVKVGVYNFKRDLGCVYGRPCECSEGKYIIAIREKFYVIIMLDHIIMPCVCSIKLFASHASQV